MNINIDSNLVEKAVSDAIIASAIGEKIKKSVTDLLNRTYDSPLEEGIKACIKQAALNIIQQEYYDVIKAKIKEKLTDETMDKFIMNLWNKIHG